MSDGNLIFNERIKLLATFYNNVSVACLVTGTVIPIISLSVREKANLAVWLSMGLGILFALFFHLYAMWYLRRLRE